VVESAGHVLLVDPGYGTAARLFSLLPPSEVDAVLVTHGHPDHCVDLSAVLRARAFVDDPAPPLPVFAPSGALDAVLRLDRPGVLADAVTVTEIADGARLELGPFQVDAAALPHTWPNLGYRIGAGRLSLCYTGDTGPSTRVVDLARAATALLAEASHVDQVPPDMEGALSTARDAGRAAARADVGRLVLTHLMPDTDPDAALRSARAEFAGQVEVARPGFRLDLEDAGVS
jgi:ribonuclease BN (tRNA processing enzyme)